MLARIQAFFAGKVVNTTSPQAHIHLATAALLAEIMVIDHHLQPEELQVLQQVLQQQFALGETQAAELVSLAREQVSHSNDLYQFTRTLNNHLGYDDKCEVVKGLWKVAYADSHLDKYEEASIRKIADLLYVSHGDFLKAKKSAQP